jgi:hypothetical protein
MTQVLDSAFVEHDAYILFDKLMAHGKSWYEFNDDVPSRNKTQNKTKVIVISYFFFNLQSIYSFLIA